LKGSPDDYQGFIPDALGVEGYSKDWLEAPNQEIDHLGMTLLIDVLLKPLGFAVEIVYLDRSQGTQVNSHVMQAEDSHGIPSNPGGPMIHLLYRPSHYDILYKDLGSAIPLEQVVNEARRTSNLHVNRATSFVEHQTLGGSTMTDFSNLELNETLLSIPGFSLQPQSSHHGLQSQFTPALEQAYTTSPISASLSPVSTAASMSPFPSQFPSQQQASLTSPSMTSANPTFSPPSIQLPIHASDLSPSPSISTFRPSKYEWEAAADWQEVTVPTFQTSTFKNSHYNTAHYNNPNFQPEEWIPEFDDIAPARKR